MKILRLNLDAFGPFTGEALDLAAGRFGLHLVYGPNEAGKTSTLRALGDLLYGVPRQSPDDFVHEYKKMRLSAVLEHSDGSTLEFVRYKRDRDPICAADGTTPLDPALLERFLGGVDRAMFATMFGIDHDALIEGGREIVNGGGRLGELLFSASSGIAGLKGIQEALQADRLALFTDNGRGRVQRIPKAIEEVNQAKARIKEVTVTTEEWSRQDQAVRESKAESQRLEDERRRKFSELNRLRRIQGALKLFPERAQLLAETAALGDVILLQDDFADRRRQAEKDRDQASHEQVRARQAIAGLTSRCEAVSLPEALLAAGDEIETLNERRGAYRKAQADRPVRLANRQEHEHAAREILQSLGRPRDLAAAESFQERADDPAEIQRLALQMQQLAARRDETLDAIGRHRQRVERARRELETLALPPDLETLRAAVKAADRLGDPETRRDEARRQLEPLEKALTAAVRRLPGWSGSASELEDLTAPLPETVERFEDRFQEAEARRRELESDRQREEKAIAELEARLQSETRQRDLPTEDDLSRSRQAREEGWRLILRAWLEGRDDPAAADFAAEQAPGRTLAEAYEQVVARSDALADRLRREANDVARRAEQLARVEGHRGQLARVEREEAEARHARERLAEAWDAATSALGLTAAFTPSELRSWLTKREQTLETLAKVRAKRAEVEQIDRLTTDHAARLTAALGELGETPPAGSEPSENWTALVERAHGLMAKSEAITRRRERLESELAKEEVDLENAERSLARIEADRDELRGPWAECMNRIGLERDASPEQANVFVQKIRDLRDQIRKANEFASWIRAIDRDGQAFAADVVALVRRIAPDLDEGESPDALVGTLQARLRAARDDDQTVRSLREQIAVETEALEAAEHALAEARLELGGLCREARCATVEELPEAERRSQRRLRLEAELKRCEEQIRALSAGASIEAFIAEAGDLDPDGLDLTIAALDAELAELQPRILEINRKIGAQTERLDAIDGSSKAAEANEQAGYALARLQSDVPRYAALRIASYVLQQGIDRYRERAQGPLIRRASRLFATLTAGSFGGLLVDYDDRGNAVLFGVRPDGETRLGVQCMSEGSSDQLYLALRIASLENWLAAHEPIPLVVDDVLLQFDDDRSAVALQVLAELSRQTQVIFFTHHAHLVELARAELPADVLFVHELSPRGAAAAPTS